MVQTELNSQPIPITSQHFDTACLAIQSGQVLRITIDETAPDITEENHVATYVDATVAQELSVHWNWKDGNGNEPNGANHWGARIVGALKGEGSWPGVVNDFLGLTGFNPTHEFVVQSLGHKGILDQLTLREVQGLLLRIGVPLEDLATTMKNIEAAY